MRKLLDFDNKTATRAPLVPIQGKRWSLGLEFDPATQEVRLNGAPITLRRKSLQLLFLLVEHHRRVVSKDEIVAAVWENAAVGDATVVGCILEIRKALGDDPKSPTFVKTISGLGYRWIAPVEDNPSTNPPAVRTRWPVYAGIAAFVILAAAGVWLTRQALQSPPAGAGSERRSEAAWWKLDGADANGRIPDLSGSGLTGSIDGEAKWEPGRLGMAMRFDGLRTRIYGTDPGRILARGNQPRSMSAWINSASTNGDSTIIMRYGTPDQNWQDSFHLMLRPDARAALLTDNHANLQAGMVSGGSALNDGSWHHIAGTFSGGERGISILYVDGLERSEAAVSFTRMHAEDDTYWSIGGGLRAGGTTFRGLIDDVRIYQRVLIPAEVLAMYRCTSGATDIEIPGRGPHFYMPVFDGFDSSRRTLTVRIEPPGTSETASRILNDRRDFAGIQFARRRDDCSAAKLRGTDVGQDLYMSADVLTPYSPEGQAQAGLFFRGRNSGPGDGMLGPVNTGYWVRLDSTGAVSIKNLYRNAVIAFTRPPVKFDATVFHRLEIAAKGDVLDVAVDGQRQEFDQGGVRRATVDIPPDWEGPNLPGKNHGTAGVLFGAESSRGFAGGQQVRSLQFEAFRPLR